MLGVSVVNRLATPLFCAILQVCFFFSGGWARVLVDCSLMCVGGKGGGCTYCDGC